MFTDLIALLTIVFWPIIPIFWIPVHYANSFFKRLGLMTYIFPIFIWLPLAYIIFLKRDILLSYNSYLPDFIRILGLFLFISGILLHFWTIKLLGLLTIIGVPEISPAIRERLVRKGPFSMIRHPTYLAHSLIFFGVFLLTGKLAVLILAVIDFIIVNIFIIPSEEKELISRYGTDYIMYRKEVRYKLIPYIL